MLSGDMRYRVYNKCKHDIGVMTTAGIPVNIKAGNFQMLTINDILYIETSCRNKKYFSAKMLVPYDDNNTEIKIEDIGLYPDPSSEHIDDDYIATMLKQSVKKIEAWLDEITDEAELHSIYMKAMDMDLNVSKLKVLKAKMPTKDWLNERD